MIWTLGRLLLLFFALSTVGALPNNGSHHVTSSTTTADPIFPSCPSGSVPSVISSGPLPGATEITVVVGVCSSTSTPTPTSRSSTYSNNTVPTTVTVLASPTGSPAGQTLIGTATQTVPASSSAAFRVATLWSTSLVLVLVGWAALYL
ncbi:SubName: Full=Uncharacterized protein {ECO:0000313/EMBL:CCA68361.1} [Serendipita indica DSM 11827]|uniref:Uncharacterized protein n=1 Tax=Serendipita indica (strain DSM 11827) TaxID=1109443 RepID=G4TAL5_SERID|nr:SubName: Full=Uncharacterized protein {ECO:0000313/EMBL:CCA68361.1} [Serendipita indica DSM 11827]CCA68361.1 hypothetical protein PIIN_02227 [Serendipita indica DSM 11827]